ncbi:MAG: arginase family protein [Alphaproteobacteria bacterium]|nr:arginase family protein [Alphaproteobacteria bacterium]
MTKFIGTEYSRGATANIIDGGPALAPRAVQKMFPNDDWVIITPDDKSIEDCMADRFGDAFEMLKKIYSATPIEKHILIGGDHSVNFGHFSAISDMYPNEDLCLIYFDAHLDIHSPKSSIQEASGAPHGTNVRHLLGEGDERWLSLCKKKPALRPENLFYFGSRSFEPSEIKYVKDNNIFYRTPLQLQTPNDWESVFSEVRKSIGNKKFIISFDFDGLDPKYFKDVWVPESNGLSLDFARAFLNEFSDAIGFEFVEYAVSGDKDSENIVRELIGILLEKFA